MSNTTIYPYGTTGLVPANLQIVNDLSTGGVDKALSAEMGKVIGALLSAFPEAGLVEEDGIYFVDVNMNVGAKIDNSGFSAINSIITEDI